MGIECQYCISGVYVSLNQIWLRENENNIKIISFVFKINMPAIIRYSLPELKQMMKDND